MMMNMTKCIHVNISMHVLAMPINTIYGIYINTMIDPSIIKLTSVAANRLKYFASHTFEE